LEKLIFIVTLFSFEESNEICPPSVSAISFAEYVPSVLSYL